MSSKVAKAALVPVTVHTMEADLSVHIPEKSTGQELFDMVCHALNLREHCYFGLQFQDPKEGPCWLQLTRKILEQVMLSGDQPLQFLFLVEFYPEDVSEELVQELTQHLFFLQVRQAILDMEIYCPPEASVLLASYAVQAKYSDFEESTFVPGMLAIEELLPQQVIDQFQMTSQMWEERIKIWYADHRGLSRDDAEMEYLKIAQDLDMYGLSYYQIKNKKNTDVWLGVNALGLNIYESQNRLSPVVSFAWSEIKDVACSGKKFMIKTLDKNQKEAMVFYSNNQKMNTTILDLCRGNHRLYVQRRKPDSLEVQQMKQQAKEEKIRRQQERQSLSRERELRQLAEQEADGLRAHRDALLTDKMELETRMQQLQEEISLTREALMRSEETAELLGQKAEIFEEENKLLTQKVAEAEVEITRIRVSAIRTEEEKFVIEQRAKEAEFLVSRVVEDSERRTLEMDHLKQELNKARQAETLAKERLTSLASNSLSLYNRYGANGPSGSSYSDISLTNGASANAVDLMAAGDMNQLSLEIEKERMEYMEKSKHLHEQLKDLRVEIENMKVEEKQTQLDRLHDEIVQRGENKYSTLQKTKAGTTQSRVAFFQDL